MGSVADNEMQRSVRLHRLVGHSTENKYGTRWLHSFKILFIVTAS